MNNNLFSWILFVLLGVVAIGGYFYPIAGSIAGSPSPSGSTFNDAKVALVEMSPATSAASSTSIFNAQTDRWITGGKVACQGVGTSQTYLTGTGLSGWVFTAATTSTAAQSGSTNYALNMNVGTSSVYAYTSTSTVASGVTEGGVGLALWPANTYLTFTFNATNTAACVVGVDYINS